MKKAIQALAGLKVFKFPASVVSFETAEGLKCFGGMNYLALIEKKGHYFECLIFTTRGKGKKFKVSFHKGVFFGLDYHDLKVLEVDPDEEQVAIIAIGLANKFKRLFAKLKDDNAAVPDISKEIHKYIHA